MSINQKLNHQQRNTKLGKLSIKQKSPLLDIDLELGVKFNLFRK